MDKNKRVLVTGARGLVGSAVIDQLQSDGFADVVAVGRNECDLTNSAATRELFARYQPVYVFHAAARVYGIMGNMRNQALSFYDNCLINTNVVDAARRSSVEKITVMGTGAIYPYPSPGLPLKEEMIFSGRPHPAESAYANAKRAMLAMLEAYQESYGLRWAYVVSCNLFGERDKFDVEFGHVVPSLVKKFYDAKQSGGPVVVWGDGSAKRDFMYVKDAARVSVEIMKHIEGPCNIGSGRVLSIKEVVDALGSITGLSDRIVWDQEKPNGQDYRAYDLSRLRDLKFSCKYAIEDGLRSTWMWYCDNARAIG